MLQKFICFPIQRISFFRILLMQKMLCGIADSPFEVEFSEIDRKRLRPLNLPIYSYLCVRPVEHIWVT